MALNFKYAINLSEHSTDPAVVHQAFMINETDGSLIEYYRLNSEAAEKSQPDDGPNDYDNLHLNTKTKKLASKSVSRIGVRSFPGLGAYGFYKDKFSGLSTIVCPIEAKGIRYKVPTLTLVSSSNNKLKFKISAPVGTNYECYRIVLANGLFSDEYITYEEDFECDYPKVKGTYEFYCIGYFEKEQRVSGKSNVISFNIAKGEENFSIVDAESYYTKSQVNNLLDNVKVTMDETPIKGSDNPVTSNGLYDAISSIESRIDNITDFGEVSF